MTPECFPGLQEKNLLDAALAPAPQALAAWSSWREHNTLDACSYVSHRLLSLIYRRIPREAIPKEDFLLLRGLYRYHWTRNQLLVRSAIPILSVLQENGIDTLVLKGLALAHLIYKDLGVRPMNDFDVLVKPEQRDLAVEVLENAGWRASQPMPAISADHGAEFCNQEGHRFDLHWYSTDESRWSGADADFWEASVPFPLHPSVTSRAPDPAHLLLHVLIHGVKVTQASPLVWVADACAILESEPSLDWGRLLESACRRRVILTISLGLNFLKDTMNRPVPSWVLQELASTPVSLTDRLYFQTKIRCGTGWFALARPYLDYLRCERPGWGGNLPGFVRFLCRRWKLDRVSQLPGRIWNGISRRLRKSG